MNAKEFVSCWKKEKINILKSFTNISSESLVTQKIASLNLNSKQNEILEEILDEVLNDTFYNLLLGLDGSTNIGEIQAEYKIYDEDNNLISESGEIEAEAWEQFHG